MTSTVVVNKHAEPFDVYIGRGSKWGNPFTHLPVAGTKAQTHVATREDAVARYEAYIQGRPDLMASLSELRGKRLGCFCKPKACHGDVLVRMLDELDALAQEDNPHPLRLDDPNEYQIYDRLGMCAFCDAAVASWHDYLCEQHANEEQDAIHLEEMARRTAA